MEDSRPTKRARQACEPCRRKKSKCPGEKPMCSYCERLGQICVYESGSDSQGQRARSDRSLELRMETLEEKLDLFMDRLDPVINDSRRRSASQQEGGHTPRSLVGHDELPYIGEIVDLRPASGTESVVEPSSDELASLYLTWLHRQPLVLFNAETFAESLPRREAELVLALQALCLRFPPRLLSEQYRQRLHAMAQASRQSVMDKVFGSRVDCSVLQTLCLLSLFEHAEGNTVQAGLHLSTAIQLLSGIPKGSFLGDAVEFNNCIRSIFVLHHLQGSVSSSVWPTAMSHGEDYLGTSQCSAWLLPPEKSPSCDMDRGIMKYTIPLAQIWRTVRVYASRRVFSDTLPPWNPRSDYSQVTYRHLEIDCSVPLKYRFSANQIDKQTPETLQQNRGYWGPYLFTQFVYASIPVILNHPFLLSMRLRHFRYVMPQSFVNSSFDAITRHIGWIMYHLDVLEKFDYRVSDPTLAHVVAVVATIHLQHSFVEDFALREKAKAGFEKCLEFLRCMGLTWHGVAVMHENLRKLQQSIQVAPLASEAPEMGRPTQQKFTIDTRLLWDILSYEHAGRPDARADESIYRGLASTHHDPTRGIDGDVDGYDLVGSAGIIGHKTVPKDTPLYAPGEGEVSHPIRGRVPSDASGLLGSLQQNIQDGFGSAMEPDNIFPQVHDFGRAIDEWLSLDWGNTML
ncbi:quinic acid utilization activator [Fusarium pseudocircinatum]|uniref:Quinic acid utilization activator n=1 Tax=Fusarium pseudocircinatum TaxID=56676 RepID=A0A8H5PJ69_9HYPO|nr:quinic acid utilization activator [Fusarium pseudocircinatum]